MTREEASKVIKDGLEDMSLDFADEEQYEALTMAIKALDQEPCPNAISRSDMLDAVGHGTAYTSEDLQKIIKALPPVNAQQKYEDIAKAFQFGMAFGFGEKYDKMDKVINEITKVITPQPKTGHWITWKEAGNDIPSETRFECSVCHDAAQTLCNGLDLLSPFCPNCGAKMIEPQESEGA